jgi:hypothetical protein
MDSMFSMQSGMKSADDGEGLCRANDAKSEVQYHFKYFERVTVGPTDATK